MKLHYELQESASSHMSDAIKQYKNMIDGPNKIHTLKILT